MPRCFDLCPSFNTLFDRIDRYDSDVTQLKPAELEQERSPRILFETPGVWRIKSRVTFAINTSDLNRKVSWS